MNDSETILSSLIEALDGLTKQIPITVDLWSTKEIAYLKLSESRVRQDVIPVKGFPKAFRLPREGGKRGHPRWRAIEVIRWSEKFQSK